MHGWLKLVTNKSTWTPFNHRYSLSVPASLGLPGSLSQGSYAPSLGEFQIKHLYILVPSQVSSPHRT